MFMQSFVAIIVTVNVTVTVTVAITVIIIPSNGNIAFRSLCIIYAIFACENFSTEIKQINELCVVRHDLRFIQSPNTSFFFIKRYKYIHIYKCALFISYPPPHLTHTCSSLSIAFSDCWCYYYCFLHFLCALWFRSLYKHSLISNSRSNICLRIYGLSCEYGNAHSYFSCT